MTDGSLKATYAPLPYSRALVEAQSSAVPQPQQVAHWRYATDIAFNAAGTRFAAVGKGGWVCMWRLDAQWADTAHGRMGCCDWSHQCMSKQGDAVAFACGKSSLLAVGGSGGAQHNVALWDVLVPLQKACVAQAPAAHHVNDLAIADDHVTLVCASAGGAVEAFDLRMLGPPPSDRRSTKSAGQGAQATGVLWRHEHAHRGSATCVAHCPAGFVPSVHQSSLVATGATDGSVSLWDVRTGEVRQRCELLHWVHGRGLFGFGASEDRHGCKVKSIEFTDHGLLSAGHSGSVLLTPWA